ncbi:MAG: hypothetical protein QM689_08680 [Oscillospiraceae bacterium]
MKKKIMIIVTTLMVAFSVITSISVSADQDTNTASLVMNPNHNYTDIMKLFGMSKITFNASEQDTTTTEVQAIFQNICNNNFPTDTNVQKFMTTNNITNLKNTGVFIFTTVNTQSDGTMFVFPKEVLVLLTKNHANLTATKVVNEKKFLFTTSDNSPFVVLKFNPKSGSTSITSSYYNTYIDTSRIPNALQPFATTDNYNYGTDIVMDIEMLKRNSVYATVDVAPTPEVGMSRTTTVIGKQGNTYEHSFEVFNVQVQTTADKIKNLIYNNEDEWKDLVLNYGSYITTVAPTLVSDSGKNNRLTNTYETVKGSVLWSASKAKYNNQKIYGAQIPETGVTEYGYQPFNNCYAPDFKSSQTLDLTKGNLKPNTTYYLIVIGWAQYQSSDGTMFPDPYIIDFDEFEQDDEYTCLYAAEFTLDSVPASDKKYSTFAKVSNIKPITITTIGENPETYDYQEYIDKGIGYVAGNNGENNFDFGFDNMDDITDVFGYLQKASGDFIKFFASGFDAFPVEIKYIFIAGITSVLAVFLLIAVIKFVRG